MRIERWNGRTCIFGFDGEGLAVFQDAYRQGLLPEGRKVFLGSTKFFCQIQNGIMTTHCMRSNWNGWHDCGAYSLPDFSEVGRMFYANPAQGLHRDTVTL